MPNNLLENSFAADKIYIHVGLTSAIDSSFDTATAYQVGLTYCQGDIISGNYSTGVIYRYTGETSVVKETFNGPSSSCMDFANDGTNIFSISDTNNKIYKHAGISSTIMLSFATPASDPYGVTYDGSNIISSDFTARKIYIHAGVTSSIFSSFGTPNNQNPTAHTWDGTNLWTATWQQKIYKHSGATSTILLSFASQGGAYYAQGLGYSANPYYTPANSVYPQTYATFARVTRRTIFSAGWANKLMCEVSAIQAEYNDCRGSFSTLASFLAVARGSSGAWLERGLAHSNFVISAGMHHSKLHATDHVVSADKIPIASAGTPGLMASAQVQKLSTIATLATKNKIKRGSYTGGAEASKFISVGFQPEVLMVFKDTISHAAFSTIAWNWQEGMTGAVAEKRQGHLGGVCSDLIITSTGFRARYAADDSGKVYRYIAMK